MNPIAQIAILALQELIKEAPDIVKQIQLLFSKGDVTVEQLVALRDEIQAQTFEQLAPNAAAQLKEGPQV